MQTSGELRELHLIQILRLFQKRAQLPTCFPSFHSPSSSEEGVTAKEGLLLWCQRKTADYSEVDVQNFTHSFRDGLALCALIHKHRPDLLDYDSLPKSDPHACTRLAFEVAQNSLDIPQLLDVEDLCDAKKPDERSVMTYVAQYFHAFSSMEHAEVNSRRVSKFTDVMLSAWIQQNDYERRAREVSLRFWSGFSSL